MAEWRYIALPHLTLALDGVSGQLHTLTALPPGKERMLHTNRVCMSPIAFLDTVKKRKLVLVLGIES
jgi:hypothetical protein